MSGYGHVCSLKVARTMSLSASRLVVAQLRGKICRGLVIMPSTSEIFSYLGEQYDLAIQDDDLNQSAYD